MVVAFDVVADVDITAVAAALAAAVAKCDVGGITSRGLAPCPDVGLSPSVEVGSVISGFLLSHEGVAMAFTRSRRRGRE